MTNKFEIRAEWFLPTDKSRRVYGTLSFDPQEETYLKLYGSLSGDDFSLKFKDHEIILGLTSDSKLITLNDCLMIKSGGALLVQGGESGKPSTTYMVRYLLIGVHCNSVNDLKFNRISSEIFNLDEWIGISGFMHENYDDKKINNNVVTVEYILPEPIDFDIDAYTKGRFNFSANYPELSHYQKTVTIKQKVEFQASTISEKGIDDLLKYVIAFQNFLTFALYRSTYPCSISLSGDRHKDDYEDGKIYHKNIELYFSSSNVKVNEKPKLNFEMIYDYTGIKSEFPTIIKNWYAKYKSLEPAFDLVLQQFYNRNMFTVNSFLNLAQSAETFHATIHDHTKLSGEDYKKMREEILAVAHPNYHPWLNDQFDFGNKLNLHSRLKELTVIYSNQILDSILGDIEQFIKNVKDSRNYYTHYSKKDEKKALKGKQLYNLSERLQLLLVCSFLIEVGINKTNLSACLEKIKWIHFNHLVNWRVDKEEKDSL